MIPYHCKLGRMYSYFISNVNKLSVNIIAKVYCAHKLNGIYNYTFIIILKRIK